MRLTPPFSPISLRMCFGMLLFLLSSRCLRWCSAAALSLLSASKQDASFFFLGGMFFSFHVFLFVLLDPYFDESTENINFCLLSMNWDSIRSTKLERLSIILLNQTKQNSKEKRRHLYSYYSNRRQTVHTVIPTRAPTNTSNPL